MLAQRPPSWFWSTVYITVWYHLTTVKVGQGMQSLSVDHSEQLPDRISTCDVNRGYYVLLLFLFVLLLFFGGFFLCFVWFCFLFCFVFFVFVFFVVVVVFSLCFFFRDSNIISIGTVEFRYYVVILIPVNLAKPEAIGD